MSIINKMLQELDRRHARAAPPGHAPHSEVRVVHPAHGSREWFWRVTAALLLIAACWTVWVIYQLQPRSVATELAYRAAENTRRRAATVATAAPAPAVPVAAAPVAKAAPPPPAEKPAPEKLAAPIETLRLALTIDTPLAQRPARQAKVASAGASIRTADAGALRTKRDGGLPPRIEKRERDRTPADRAEHLFRVAAQALERGRVADAEEALTAALQEDHSHQAARQTLIALYIDQGRIEEARRQLQEGLAVNPSYAPFAVALARIHVDRHEYDKALELLEQAGESGRNNADFQSLRGAILQRLGRNSEAADAYRLALGSVPQSGASWVGLGISLEALGNVPEAAEAYRRGVAAGNLTKEVRAYAEQRVRQLQ
jgi:MSHA biogenesis protein MshN